MKVNLHYFSKIKSKKESVFGSGSGTLAEMEINLFRWLQRKENIKKLNLNIHLGASADTGRRTPPPSSEDTYLKLPSSSLSVPETRILFGPFRPGEVRPVEMKDPTSLANYTSRRPLDIYSFAENGDYCLHPPSFNRA